MGMPNTSSLIASLMQLFPGNPAAAAGQAVTAVITWQWQLDIGNPDQIQHRAEHP